MGKWFTCRDVRIRRVFAWLPIRTSRKWFWLEWVRLGEDRRFRYDDYGDGGAWRLVSVNDIPVD